MGTEFSQDWFEMRALRRRRFANSVWIPLRTCETIHLAGDQYGKPGYVEEFLGIGSVAIYLDKRPEAEKLQWMDIGICHNGGPYAFREGNYKPCEVYQYNEGEDLGIDLVFEQPFIGDHPRIWHLNQDLILSLGLLKEGNVWIRPEEGYVEVVRERKNDNGAIVAIEIRSEFLRDYLAARGLALRLSYYRQRLAVLENPPQLSWPEQGLIEEAPHDRFNARNFEVGSDGAPYGGGVAVFHVARTDVDPDEDVPVFGPEDNSNTEGGSYSFTRGGPKFHRLEGALWREEWIEPAKRSERVRGDQPEESIYFLIDGSGEPTPSHSLDNEDVGRYLWFNARVINSLTSWRGSGLEWYTRETGGVWCSPGYKTHFGVNRLGLINVYAFDVAKLPLWQQKIWVGHNVAPDGAVSSELLASQMKAEPAHTTAPEKAIERLISEIDLLSMAELGAPLFRAHDAASKILRELHRFRAADEAGLLALAKDATRLIADRIDVGILKGVVSPPSGEKWGSLKLLEKTISRHVPEDEARKILGPLIGVYNLRLADAHLPSKETEEAYTLVGIDTDAPAIEKGRQLLHGTATALHNIARVLAEQQNLSA